jgi:proline-specific peptidase
MWGPSEFCVTGTLKDWDITNRLSEIRIPALVICGRYDEATPVLAETIHHGIPGSELVIFEYSAHFPHIEETERYIQVLNQFLSRVEAG